MAFIVTGQIYRDAVRQRLAVGPGTPPGRESDSAEARSLASFAARTTSNSPRGNSTAWGGPDLRSPQEFLAHAMPANHGGWLHHHERTAPIEQPRQDGQLRDIMATIETRHTVSRQQATTGAVGDSCGPQWIQSDQSGSRVSRGRQMPSTTLAVATASKLP
jgi:hypothetical protein